MKKESELSQKMGQLKMQSADGKFYLTDVAGTEQLFRLIQSIPSPKAEPFKRWLARVGSERLDEMQDPELSIDRALEQSQGGNVARVARKELEAKTGKKVVTSLNAKSNLKFPDLKKIKK